MSIANEGPARRVRRHELDALRARWGWFLALGLAMIVLGVVATGASLFFTLLTVTFLGSVLIVGGLTQALGAFWSRYWSGFFSHLLIGVLYLVSGVLILANPVLAAINLTLLLAFLMIAGGLGRIVFAAVLRFPHWGWAVLNGAITTLIGFLIWGQWPDSGHWVLGLFFGIGLVFDGWAWVFLGLAMRRLAAGGPAATPTAGLP